MTWKLTAIVSGAQTGADRGGLQAAIDLDLGWGGWAPAGWRAEDGEIPLIYRERMKLTSSSDYGMRTRLNVQDSDGTLIISFAEKLTGGSEFTMKTCERTNKSHLHLVLPDRGRAKIPEEVRAGVLEWIDKAHINVLNVAGPRESKEPGLQEAVRDALVWIFEDAEIYAAVADLEREIEATPLPFEVTRLSGVTLDAVPDEDGTFVRTIEEQAARIALLGTQPDSLDGIDITLRSFANYERPLEGSFQIDGDFVDPYEGRTPWPYPNEDIE